MMEIVLRTLTKKKTLLLMGLFFGLFSLLSFIFNPFFDFLIETLNIGLSRTSLSIALLLASAFSLSLIYLQSGGGEEKYENHPLELLLKELESQRKLTTEQLKELREKVESYESKNTLTEEEKRLIIDGAVEQTSQDAIKTIFATEAENLRNSIKDSLGFERLTERSYDITRRLRREITDLRLRSNINLLIGMSITAGGLYLLWTTVSIVDSSELLKQLASEGNESNYKFIKNIILPIIPRVMLVVFVEVFAYFFLRLYKNGLAEIKYFQNELTNVESKLAAVEFSFITNNPDGLRTSIESLSKTERNFILDKGQTTVELERAKSESELTRNIIKTIPAFFKNNRK
ncbi:hypothetical protein QQW52_001435 [Escherichia coli]|uniref:hypothetical protein n=1 Tax=Escherichia TaxID=561 RepID=UPI0006A6596A|nr:MULTISPECIES: hypothetical protein [Escherichia]EKL2588920.1 hypothetical protein [Escherichia coli]EKV4140640.1 hypothetical protein [Escherichia coli]ELJ4051180.1 hypothetical protein [Escherichia coli]ELK1042625.1 hypothetical protein [Escherichia coli]ELQ6913171.1 hypothetical protein [Escherichia coli]